MDFFDTQTIQSIKGMICWKNKVCPCLLYLFPILAPDTNDWLWSLVYVSPAVIKELKRMIDESEILKEDDKYWPEPDDVGRQEIEILYKNNHISFLTTKIGSLVDIQDSEDVDGLKVFYYLVQDLKCLVFSLISLHFKIKPIQN